MKKTATKVVASLFAFSLIAAACGGSDDAADAPAEESTEEATSEEASSDEIVEITVTGPERSDEEAGALQQVLGAWGDANGASVTYIGDADWEANINVRLRPVTHQTSRSSRSQASLQTLQMPATSFLCQLTQMQPSSGQTHGRPSATLTAFSSAFQ